MACTAGCLTKDHGSYGECLRSKSVRVSNCNEAGGRDTTKQRKWDRELDRARNLMSQGVLPRNTFGPALDDAERRSDATGKPYRADG